MTDRHEFVRDDDIKVKGRRDWLNPPNSPDTGWVSWKTESGKGWMDVYLNISDCNRNICLDFSFTNNDSPYFRDSVEDRLTKIDLLLDSIKELRKEMVKHRPRKKKAVSDT